MIVGQIVVCVDDVFPAGIERLYAQLPRKGIRYSVRSVSLGVNWNSEPGEVAITLNELRNPRSDAYPYPERAFNAQRFRPLTEDEELEQSMMKLNATSHKKEIAL